MDEERKPFEEWAKIKPNKHFPVAIFTRGLRWPAGRLVTEAEYDAAVHDVLTTAIGYQVDGVKVGGAK